MFLYRVVLAGWWERRTGVNMMLRGLTRRVPRRLMSTMPTQARVVVAGGGIVGTSVAYHLAKMGW